MLIEQFLDRYYKRYPSELELDPTIDDIYKAIGNGVSVYVDSNILVLYSLLSDGVMIYHYWCDAKYEVSIAYKQHKKFVRLFDCDVYIRSCKLFYNRKYVYEYISSLSMYKFIK